MASKRKARISDRVSRATLSYSEIMADISINIDFLSASQNKTLQSIKAGDLIQLRQTCRVDTPQVCHPEDPEEDLEDKTDADYSEDNQDAEHDSDEDEHSHSTMPEDHVNDANDDAAPSSASSDTSAIGERSNSNAGEDSSVTSPTGESIPLTTLFLVKKIKTDSNGHVTELMLLQLEYKSEVQVDKAHSYQIYGSAVMHSGSAHSNACKNRTTLSDLHNKYDLAAYSIHINPSGDDLRQFVSSHGCPAGCDEGFLDHLAQLPKVLDTEVFATPASVDHRPVCPVCMGLDLLIEHQGLRVTLEESSMVDIGTCVEFTGNFNRRGRQLHYSFYQYDEREWGMLFDDMDIDHEDDHDTNDNVQWQHYAEAMDTQSQIRSVPASDTVINSLPVIPLAKARTTNRDVEKCLICQEDFGIDAVVTQLPCGHVYCENECVQQWLKYQDRCPKCRKTVSVVAVI